MKNWRKTVWLVLIISMLFSTFVPLQQLSRDAEANPLSGLNQVTIYYKKGFSNAFIHYRLFGETWTKSPGSRLTQSEIGDFLKITIVTGSALGIEACFNNGAGMWDSNQSKNYKFNKGVFTYVPGQRGAAGTITQGLPYKDGIAPTAPQNVKTGIASPGSIALEWNASSDNFSVAGYEVFRDNVKIANTIGVSYTVMSVASNTSSTFSVRAFDFAGNVSAQSAPLTVTSPIFVDNTVTLYYKAPASWTQVFMHYQPIPGSWTKAPGIKMDRAEVPGYFKKTVSIGAAPSLEAVFNNGSALWDNNGMRNYLISSGTSTVEQGKVVSGAPLVDTQVPSQVSALKITGRTQSSLSLNWTASTDNVGVISYELYRNKVKVADSVTTQITDSGLQPGTTYVYTVQAVDAAGNRSVNSTELSGETEREVRNEYRIFYKIPTSWNDKAFIHFRFAGGLWSALPGMGLSKSEEHPGYGVFVAQNTAASVEAVFNNGGTQWDNNFTKNYMINSGTFTLADGKLITGAPVVPTLDRIVSIPATSMEIAVNESRSLIVEAVYSDGSKRNITTATTISVADSAIAESLANGQMTGRSVGNTEFTVSFQGKTTTLTVNVTKAGISKPTRVSVNSLYLSNWKDSLNIWMASKLAQTDRNTVYGPRIAEMRIKEDFTTNQIRDYTSFFRDESSKINYTDVAKFDAEAYLDEKGALRTKYLTFAGTKMPVSISKDFVTVPNEDYTVATMTFKNETNSPIEYNMLEQLRLNNKTAGKNNASHKAWYDNATQTMYVDMTASGQYFAALTALQPINSFQIGEAELNNGTIKNASPLAQFNVSGTLRNNEFITAPQLALAFQERFVIPANSSIQRSFAVTIQPTLERVRSAVTSVKSKSASDWFSQTATMYEQWLNGAGKKQLATSDEGFQLAYKRNLVMIKNSINPVSGAMPATTNPFAYGYKVWARDSAVTAMILDQAGFHEEARKYWYWLNARMRDDGTVGTCYDLWTDRWVTFVDPEHDSIGFFLLGVYQHYKLTGDKKFLQDMWYKYRKSADFVWASTSKNPYGYGAIDHSIWEEFMEYNTFTQAAYVAGLNGAQHVSRILGQPSLADNYNNAALKIVSMLQKTDTSGQGMWNEKEGYYNRAVNANGTLKTLVDASSAALIVYGVIDAKSSRAQSHVQKLKSNLQHDGYGIARYDGDDYYFSSIYNPGGDEVLSSEPAWPQMSMYVALHHIHRNEYQLAHPYMKWMVERMFVGYMAQGEAVSNVLQAPASSTSPEPVTGAWFIYTALAYEGKADMRVNAP